MKAKIIRADMEVAPSADALPEGFVAENSVPHPSGQVVAGRTRRLWKVGTVLSHPDAYRLVQMGCAVPEDEECRKKCNLTPEQMADMQRRYEKLKIEGSYTEELRDKANAIQVIDEADDE